MNFEYDKNKSLANKKKHGIDFEEAKMLWLGDNVILPAITKGEPRYMIIGRISLNMYSCIFTRRKKRIRIISCRKARDKEEKVYHEKIA
jgi:uncharacterized protein